MFPDTCWAFQITLGKDKAWVEAFPLFYLLVSDRPKNRHDFTKAFTSHSVEVTLLSALHPSCELLVEGISLQASLCDFPGQGWSHLFAKARIAAAAGQLLTSLLLFAVLAKWDQYVQKKSPSFFILCFHSPLEFTKCSPGVSLCSSAVHCVVSAMAVLTPALERITPEMLPLVL